MKIPPVFQDFFKHYPILKNSGALQNYFIDKWDAHTEKARIFIEKYQNNLARRFLKTTKKSYLGTDSRLRTTREATEKEKKYYLRWTTGLSYYRLLLRVRAIEFGTPTFKANICRDRGAKIGENVFFTMGNFIDPIFTREIEIGENTILHLAASIICHEFKEGNGLTKNLRIGKVKIGKNVFIGPGAIILPGVTIGDNSFVGPGIHVHNIPENYLAFGLPDNLQRPYTDSATQLLEGDRRLEDLDAEVKDFKEYVPIFKKGSYNVVTALLLELQRQRMPQQFRHILLGLAGVKVDPSARIEHNVFFDHWNPEKIKINEGVHIKQHAVSTTHEGLKDSPVRVGDVEIGKNALLEVGSGVLPGTKIGENAEVMPYSAAITDVEDNAQVYGMPAMKDGETFDIENFFAQHFQYSSNTWDEIQAFKKKEREELEKKNNL